MPLDNDRSLPNPGPVALGGMDLFHHRNDAELRSQRGGFRNGCALVAHLSGTLDVTRLERRLDALPEWSWRLEHRWLRPPAWRVSPRRAVIPVVTRPLTLETAVAHLDHVDEHHPFSLRVYRAQGRDSLLLQWYHAATDARGAVNLLRWLGSDAVRPPDRRHATSDAVLNGLPPERIRELGFAYIQRVRELGQAPIRSPHRARSGGIRREQRAIDLRFSDDETATFDRATRTRAFRADTSLWLVSLARAMRRWFVGSGVEPPRHWVVPVPVSLDPPRAQHRFFGNNLTMMMAGLDNLDDEGAAIRSLALQRRAMIEKKLDVGAIALLHRSKVLPWRIADVLARHPFGGERCSFLFSNIGRIRLETFAGHAVQDAFALPCVLPSPGIQFVAQRHGARQRLLTVVREDVITAASVRPLLPALRASLR
ncbi:MAG: hypothetical protein AAGA56_02820 [Myxococcota bacterium]